MAIIKSKQDTLVAQPTVGNTYGSRQNYLRSGSPAPARAITKAPAKNDTYTNAKKSLPAPAHTASSAYKNQIKRFAGAPYQKLGHFLVESGLASRQKVVTSANGAPNGSKEYTDQDRLAILDTIRNNDAYFSPKSIKAAVLAKARK